ncbi:hypothetical protein GA0116948_11662 [Chitinophaga costaii]|uniref:Uncharacterized protein n=1 Tax=Chitinophaga costaii TaxID=1335309 RepID=A0A1C4FR28_9BACT|nr:hypothetical protein [Chitinophaga costaii]SCC58408.1 hypothetical protein GA0116948_11662 [Chitinophaga costaii]
MPEINRVPGAMRPLWLAGLFLLIFISVLLPPFGGRHYALLAGMPLLMVFWWTNSAALPSRFRYPMLFALLANFSQDIVALRSVDFDGRSSSLEFFFFMGAYLFTLFSVPAFLIYLFVKMRFSLGQRCPCNWVAVFGFVPITTLVVLNFITPITFSLTWLSLLYILYAITLYVLFEAVVHGFAGPGRTAGRLSMVAAFGFVLLRYKITFPTLELNIALSGSLLLFLQNAFLALLVYSTARYLNSRVIP